MSENIIKAAVALGAAAIFITTRAYKHFSSKKEPSKSLGSFVLWGRPNAGKTTFISRLRGLEATKKEATTSERKYKNVSIDILKPDLFLVDEIIDMPGTKDRLADWLKYATEKDHVFYMIDLSRISNTDYDSAVRFDISETIKALQKSKKIRKRINIIASHVDQSKWSSTDTANINNQVQEDLFIRRVYESMEDVKGYVYSANLMDTESFKQLIQSIANDCQS